MFFIGQKVVCINDDWGPLSCLLLRTPRKDVVYQIRYIRKPVWTFANAADCYLLLEEIKNLEWFGPGPDGEAAFTCDDFRPLIDRKTDISIFQQMLNPNHKTEDA